MKKAYKYRGGVGFFNKDNSSIFHRDIDTIINNQIYLPTKFELNDPTEGFFIDDPFTSFLEVYKNYSSDVRTAYQGLLEKMNNIGVYSLSKSNDNELLWAYYASGHSGFAVEYDIDLLKNSMNHNRYFQFIYDFDVDYVKKIPKINVWDIKNKDFNYILKKFLGLKSFSWKHENEYRLIVDSKGLFNIDFRAITGIYFGYRMEDSEIDLIMDKLKGRNLKYYKMSLIEQSYKFEPKEIEDRYYTAKKYVPNNLPYDDWFLKKEFMGDTYQYRDKLIEALNIVKFEPLITEIYQAVVNLESREPIFKVFAYTNKIPPVKTFSFKLNNDGNLIQIANF